jgi:thiamine pyrophosphate-dependent acetolactate synthase large subunit-like protein
MSPTALPLHAQELLRSWEEELQKLEFMVLLWGSGNSNKEASDKRRKVREYLEASLPPNSVFMSEDGVFQSTVEKFGLVGAEKVQAEMADVIIVLGTSLGPLTEVATYMEFLKEKGLLFVAKSLLESGGFAPETWHGLVLKEFTPDQLATCDQIRCWAREHVLARRFQKLEAQRREGRRSSRPA